MGVVSDDLRRGVDDRLRRAVVLFELHDLRVFEVLLEIQDVVDVRSAPRIDRLILVADDAQVAVRLSELLDEKILDTVRILILVDHDVAKLVLILFENGRVIDEELVGLHQEIAEVEGVGALHLVLVFFIDADRAVVHEVPALLHIFGGESIGLRGIDPRGEPLCGMSLVVDPESREHLLDHADLIARIVNPEERFVVEKVNVLAKDARANRVERRDPHAPVDG